MAPANPEAMMALKDKHNLHGKIILFSLGRLVKRKGFDMVIKSLTQLPFDILERIVYVVAGAGPDELFLQGLLLSNFKLKDNVLFLGKISDEEKVNWLALSDIFIMPTRNINGDFEGFGIVYLEANLAGKPVIAGQAGGAPEAVVDGVTGLVINSEDPEMIAGAMAQLINDPVLRLKLGQAGKMRAQNDFRWEDKARLIYEQIN
jgi:phosphatidylinositol alpha-1,6-mannosyltransferase